MNRITRYLQKLNLLKTFKDYRIKRERLRIEKERLIQYNTGKKTVRNLFAKWGIAYLDETGERIMPVSEKILKDRGFWKDSYERQKYLLKNKKEIEK